MNRRHALLAMSCLCPAFQLLAHNELRITGVVISLEGDKLRVRDARGKTWAMGTDKETKILTGKVPSAPAALMPGVRVTIQACGTSDADRIANEIRITTTAGAKK